MDVEGVTDGAKRAIDGCWRVFYDGYWIKAYDVPADTLRAKKGLIAALTRRLFNHVEHGVNIPGIRLNEARNAFDAEADPGKKRVKGAMLAGALFNRAIDLITKAVELQALGIEIKSSDPLIWSFAAAARVKCETLHTDPEIFDVWSTFVAEGEKLSAFQPLLSQRHS